MPAPLPRPAGPIPIYTPGAAHALPQQLPVTAPGLCPQPRRRPRLYRGVRRGCVGQNFEGGFWKVELKMRLSDRQTLVLVNLAPHNFSLSPSTTDPLCDR